MNRLTRDITASIIALALTATLAGASFAQEDGRDSGAFLGLRLLGSSLHVDNENEVFFVKDDGGGITLYGGYSFNDVFSLELDLIALAHETSDPSVDANLASAQILAHYRFAPGHNFRPYVKGGLGGYSLILDTGNGTVRIEGGGVPIGGGFDYFFTPHFSLGVDFTHNIIKYEDLVVEFANTAVTFDIEEEGAMSSIGLSFGFYF